MNRSPAKLILYAVGSLPFWTGERKLIQFLSGDPGSFWTDPPPLKPLYLGHRFFGALESESEPSLRSRLEQLKHHGYLTREPLGNHKPHRVIKLTHDGARQYYNLLSVEENHDPPCWRIQHVARLESSLNSPITTAGQVLSFSDNLHLSQTPEFVDPEDRVRDESTLRLLNPDSTAEPGQVILLKSARLDLQRGVRLRMDEETRVEPLSAGDLRRRLTHFPSAQDSSDRPNPYVIRGTLTNRPDRQDSRIRLVLTDGDGNRLSVILTPDRIPDDVPLNPDSRYVIGPVEETGSEPDDPGPAPVLSLTQNGELKPDNRFD